MTGTAAGGGSHMNELDVSAYLDGRMSAPDREQADGHLAGCSECRREVVEAQALVAKSRRPRRLLVAAVVGVAAVIVAMVVPAIRPSPTGPGSPPVRGQVGLETLAALGPIGESPAGPVRFGWRSAPAATTYRLTLSGIDGVPLWTAGTPDTSLVLPDSIRLKPDTPYYWMTDALLGDGTTRSTGLREFHLTR